VKGFQGNSSENKKQNLSEATRVTASASRETRRAEGSTGPSVQGGTKGAPNGTRVMRGDGINGQAPKSRAPQGGKHRRGSVILFRVLIVLAVLIGLVLAVRLALLFVPIKEIVVPEGGYYTEDELCDATGLEVGGRMFGFSRSRAEKKLLSEYGLLSDVSFQRTLGGTLTITAKEKESRFYVNVSGTYCLLSREDFHVLIQSESPERFEAYGFYEISLPDVRVAFLGDVLKYGDEKENEYVGILLDALDASALAGRVTGIRAAERFSLSVIIDGKYDVSLGSVKDIADKLEYFTVMENSDATEIFRSGSCAEIDLSILSAPTIRAVDAIDKAISKE